MDVVTGGVIEGHLRTDLPVALQVVAQSPRQRDARIGVEPQAVDALVAIEINRLRVVVGEHQVVEQFLAPRHGRIGQPLQGELLRLDEILVPGALHLRERVFELIEQPEIRRRIAQRAPVVGAVAARQRPDVHLAQVEAVADGDRVGICDQIVGQMLTRHPDYPVAIYRDVRIGDLVVDGVAEPIAIGADRLVVEGAVDPEIIVLAIYQPILGQPADSLRGLDVERNRRVGALVDRDVVRLQPLSAAQVRLAIAAAQQAAVPVRVGRENQVRRPHHGVAGNVEGGVLRRVPVCPMFTVICFAFIDQSGVPFSHPQVVKNPSLTT